MTVTEARQNIIGYLRAGRPDRDYTNGRGYRFANSLPRTECVDGFNVSIQAGRLLYATPRLDAGPWTHVELGFPSERPEPWTEWSQYAEEPARPCDTVYGYVPVEMVEALIALHGGQAFA